MNHFVRSAVYDGVVRAGSTACQKLAGTALNSWHGALFSTAIIECVRVCAGIFGVVKNPQSLQMSRPMFLLILVWAINAVVMTVLHIYSYEVGADQGIATLIVLCAIVPGAIIDDVFFGDRLSKRRISGILLFLLGAYCALGLPGLWSSATLSDWVYFKVIVAVLLAINEGVRRKLAKMPEYRGAKDYRPHIWVGGLSLAMLSVAIVSTGAFQQVTNFSGLFWLGSGLMGVAVTISTVLSLVVYQGKGSVTARKFLTSTTTLVLAIVSGALFYGEPLNIAKFVGLSLFIVAFMAFDDKGELGKWE